MPKLTAEKRDELLIRLDERVRDLKDEDMPEIKEHLLALNGRVRSNEVRSKVNQATLGLITSVAIGVTKLLHWW